MTRPPPTSLIQCSAPDHSQASLSRRWAEAAHRRSMPLWHCDDATVRDSMPKSDKAEVTVIAPRARRHLANRANNNRDVTPQATSSNLRGRRPAAGIENTIGAETAGVNAAVARAQRRLARETNRNGLVETAEAGAHWEVLKGDAAPIAAYKVEKEVLERKVTKLKKKVDDLHQALAVSKNNEMIAAAEVETLQERLDWEKGVTTRLYEEKGILLERLANSQQLVQLFQNEGAELPGGWSQPPTRDVQALDVFE
ncbi:hypothetical protein DFP72DRAFT_1073014 [Ephemerocybe angulata]|uniref:Uncharacterized protein n=1 Tax=Ephemerocybe angulata TaxID=980116 RepID=A0A8H6HMJ4_9AGAR|nr:hypothetical protein DFP72DRAFT_1073014 [Tulosesus angulatus]